MKEFRRWDRETLEAGPARDSAALPERRFCKNREEKARAARKGLKHNARAAAVFEKAHSARKRPLHGFIRLLPLVIACLALLCGSVFSAAAAKREELPGAVQSAGGLHSVFSVSAAKREELRGAVQSVGGSRGVFSVTAFAQEGDAGEKDDSAEPIEASGTDEEERLDEGQEEGALWSEEYYRVADASGSSTDGLSDAELKSLDEDCIDFMKTYRLDLSVIAVTSEHYAGKPIDRSADQYYEDCGFGYGPDGDGFQMVWNTQTDEVVIRAYGAAERRVPASYLRFVEGSIPKYREKYGIYGPMYATLRYLSNYLEEHDGEEKKTPQTMLGGAGSGGSLADADKTGDGGAGTGGSPADPNETGDGGSADAPGDGAETVTRDTADYEWAGDGADESEEALKRRVLPEGEYPDPSLRVGEGMEKPAWYPKDPSTFPFYHDEAAPRVVDGADIFTGEEERRMQERIAQIRDFLQKDIVIFTDVSTYGASHMDYADDFFDFNGYGYGEDFEGVCLMICMDPQDRGWWCSCYGPVTKGLYTETVANQIDDLLYEYMWQGDYGEGVLDWLENFRRLYTTGSPYNEEWALMDADGVAALRAAALQNPASDGAEAPRVVDDARLLTEDERADLETKARELSEKYGLDVAVHTAYHPGILEKEKYGELYYAYSGYGFGENYDGICLTIFKRPGYSGSCTVYGSGKGSKKLTDVNRKRLESRCMDELLNRNFYEAADQWLSQTAHMLGTGRAPRSTGSWTFWTVLECIAGLIAGTVGLGRAKRKMATPAAKENADAYVVPDSIFVRKISDTLIDTSVSRVYDPVRRESSGSSHSSSSGRSSYSSSHRSSSGRSHSGSGRRF